MGAIAAILLAAGGLGALQNGAILAATPFLLLMIVMCWSLIKAMSEDADSAPELMADPNAPAGRGLPDATRGVVPATTPRIAGGAPDQPAAEEGRRDA